MPVIFCISTVAIVIEIVTKGKLSFRTNFETFENEISTWHKRT